MGTQENTTVLYSKQEWSNILRMLKSPDVETLLLGLVMVFLDTGFASYVEEHASMPVCTYKYHTLGDLYESFQKNNPCRKDYLWEEGNTFQRRLLCDKPIEVFVEQINEYLNTTTEE